MGEWALMQGGAKIDDAGSVTASSRGVQISAAATNNTKGSYSELISATTVEAVGFWVELSRGTAAKDFLIDIAVGAATESVIVSNLHYCTGNQATASHVYIPMRIPLGSRVAARCQSNTLSSNMRIKLTIVSGGYLYGSGFSKSTTYNADTSISRGTVANNLDSGGTAQTKGAVGVLSSSLTAPAKAIMFSLGGAGDIARAGHQGLIDILIGASSEDVMIPNISYQADAGTDIPSPQFLGPYPCNLAIGERLAAQAQSDSIVAGDRVIDLVAYTFY